MTKSTGAIDWKEMMEIVKSVTGVDLTDDKERLVTFSEVSMRRQSAEHMYRKTGEKKYLMIAAKCSGALRAMCEKAAEGKALYLKPSELSKMLSL